jgi:hypothetical protein
MYTSILCQSILIHFIFFKDVLIKTSSDYLEDGGLELHIIIVKNIFIEMTIVTNIFLLQVIIFFTLKKKNQPN